jgi:tRNA threonylcarbamoyladenosine biosynthesis protein TsaB
MILCLETATNICSVALCEGNAVISRRESKDSKSHAAMVTIFINDILSEKGIKTKDLSAVAVSKGPGSYTGLRIGVSVAKGIAYGSGIPLLGITTLWSMFRGFISENESADAGALFCPMLDARRMEVFYAIYDYEGNVIREISAGIMDEDSFNDIPESKNIIFFGEGSLKIKGIIKRSNIFFDESFSMSASNMCGPAELAFREGRFEDIAYFEPLYLKDFITTIPKNKLFGNNPA